MNLETKFNIGDTAIYPEGSTLKKIKIKTIRIVVTKNYVSTRYHDQDNHEITDWGYGYPENSLFKDEEEVRKEIGKRT